MSNSSEDRNGKIIELLKEKACAKQAVYRKTIESFASLKEVMKDLAEVLNSGIRGYDSTVEVEYRDKGEFEAHFKFSGDTLVFHMHTNVFSFERHHSIWKSSYVKEKNQRAYCGVIHIYNFLSDTFKYNRINDPGFLIARIFINMDGHFFTEGKGQFGFLFNDFHTELLDKEGLKKIVQTAVVHGLNFELLSPNYQEISTVSLYQVLEMGREMRLKTSKKLGYEFRGEKS